MKIINFSIMCLILMNCSQSVGKKKKSMTIKENNQMTSKEQQITYAIHINAKTPFEIYIDDIPLERFYESGMNMTLELNPYLLENGLHILKVRYLPRPDAVDNLIQPSHIISSKDSKWNIFFLKYIKNPEEPLGYEGEIDYANSELTVIAPPEPVPVWEQEFELNINDLPYELKGWSESKDLSKMDNEQLKIEVLDYFKMIRNTLNSGNIEEFLKLNKVRDSEIAVATYDSNMDWYSSNERISNLKSTCMGNMLPIIPELYALKIYANGKIVTIERTDKFKNVGLLAEEAEEYSVYNFLLHKPKDSDMFEIIRK